MRRDGAEKETQPLSHLTPTVCVLPNSLLSHRQQFPQVSHSLSHSFIQQTFKRIQNARPVPDDIWWYQGTWPPSLPSGYSLPEGLEGGSRKGQTGTILYYKHSEPQAHRGTQRQPQAQPHGVWVAPWESDLLDRCWGPEALSLSLVRWGEASRCLDSGSSRAREAHPFISFLTDHLEATWKTDWRRAQQGKTIFWAAPKSLQMVTAAMK